MHDATQERHEMILRGSAPQDGEEWFCPSCGRRFVMRWPPNYRHPQEQV